MDNRPKRSLAWARFMALRNSPPNRWDEAAVGSFHEIVIALEEAFEVDLSTFRIPDERMQRLP